MVRYTGITAAGRGVRLSVSQVSRQGKASGDGRALCHCLCGTCWLQSWQESLVTGCEALLQHRTVKKLHKKLVLLLPVHLEGSTRAGTAAG